MRFSGVHYVPHAIRQASDCPHLCGHLGRAGPVSIERVVARAAFIAAKVHRISCRAFLETFAALGVLHCWTRSTSHSSAWRRAYGREPGGRRGGSRCGSRTEVGPDNQPGDGGQIGVVAFVVGVGCGYHDAVTGNLAAHVQDNIEAGWGRFEVGREEGNGAPIEGPRSIGVDRDAELDGHRGAG